MWPAECRANVEDGTGAMGFNALHSKVYHGELVRRAQRSLSRGRPQGA